MEVGERIRQLREKKDWSQKKLSKMVGINTSVFNRIENNTRSIRTEELLLIAGALGVPVGYLSGEEQIKDNRTPVEKLIEYLDMELTNDEIKERMNFSIDSIPLTDEDVDEFIAFVRAKRSMKKQPLASASKSEDS